MSAILPDNTRRQNLLNREIPMRQAKVHEAAHKKLAIEAYRAEVGQCIERARGLSGLTADQFAREIGCHPTQLSKWIHNIEPPQIDRVLMSPMRGYMLEALTRSTPGYKVRITIERIA
jgi:hypothetical protein